jgi:hypothetical protein
MLEDYSALPTATVGVESDWLIVAMAMVSMVIKNNTGLSCKQLETDLVYQ